MTLPDIQRALTANGFPCGTPDGVLGPATKAAVARFQTAYNNGPWLTIDGVPGPLTQKAVAQLPQLSLHFVAGELASHGNGTCYVDRQLLVALEILRNRLAMPIHVIDAYRDPAHNRSVGGASDSMHLYGLAADIPGICSWRLVAGLDVFSGIGDRYGAISHVDLRHLSSHNETPNATPASPARWTY